MQKSRSKTYPQAGQLKSGKISPLCARQASSEISYRSEQASLNARRGSRGCNEAGSRTRRLQRKFVFDVPFGEELLIAAETGLAGGEELSRPPWRDRARHGPQSRPRGARPASCMRPAGWNCALPSFPPSPGLPRRASPSLVSEERAWAAARRTSGHTPQSQSQEQSSSFRR